MGSRCSLCEEAPDLRTAKSIVAQAPLLERTKRTIHHDQGLPLNASYTIIPGSDGVIQRLPHAIIYKARHRTSNALRALKQVRTDAVDTDHWWEEVEMMGDCDHPNICRLYETFSEDKYMTQVLELCSGKDLLGLGSVGRAALTEATVAWLVRQMLGAVSHLHEKGICHTELAPECFLFTKPFSKTPALQDLCLKLVDVGLALKFGVIATKDSRTIRLSTGSLSPRGGGSSARSPRGGRNSVGSARGGRNSVGSMGSARGGRNSVGSQKEASPRPVLTKDPGPGPNSPNGSPRSQKGGKRSSGIAGAFTPARARTYCQAPEQIVYKDTGEWARHGDKCDVWAIGMMSFFLLCGKWPSTGGGVQAEALPKSLSTSSREFVAKCCCGSHKDRATSLELREHAWMALAQQAYQESLGRDEKKQSSTSQKGGGSMLDTPLPNADAILKGFQQMASMNDFERACVTALAHHLPEDKTAHLRKVFLELDTNGDGRLSAEELRQGLATVLGKGKQGAEQFQQLLATLDTDGSGSIDYTEFIAATFAMKTNLKDEICEAAFRIFDKDGSGHISISEVREVLDGPGVNFEEMEDFLWRADHNGDGQMDMHEFKDLLFVRKGNAEGAAKMSAHSKVHTFATQHRASVNSSPRASRIESARRASVTSQPDGEADELCRNDAMEMPKDGPTKWTLAEIDMVGMQTGPGTKPLKGKRNPPASSRFAAKDDAAKLDSPSAAKKQGLLRQMTGQLFGLPPAAVLGSNSPRSPPRTSPQTSPRTSPRTEGFASRLKRAFTGQKLDEVAIADKPAPKVKAKGKAKSKSRMARLKRAISFHKEEKEEDEVEEETEDKDGFFSARINPDTKNLPVIGGACKAVLLEATEGIYAKQAVSEFTKEVEKMRKQAEKEEKKEKKRQKEEEKDANEDEESKAAREAEEAANAVEEYAKKQVPGGAPLVQLSSQENYDDEIDKKRPPLRMYTVDEIAYDAQQKAKQDEEEVTKKKKRSSLTSTKEEHAKLEEVAFQHVITNVSIKTQMPPKPQHRMRGHQPLAPVTYGEDGHQSQTPAPKHLPKGEQKALNANAAIAALAPLNQGAHDAPADSSLGSPRSILDRGTRQGREARRLEGEKRVLVASAALSALSPISKGGNPSPHPSPTGSRSPRSPVVSSRNAARQRLQGAAPTAVAALLPSAQAAWAGGINHSLDEGGQASPSGGSPLSTSPRSPRRGRDGVTRGKLLNVGMLARGGARRRSVEGSSSPPSLFEAYGASPPAET